MGKKLIIKGANFLFNAIETDEWKNITPVATKVGLYTNGSNGVVASHPTVQYSSLLVYSANPGDLIRVYGPLPYGGEGTTPGYAGVAFFGTTTIGTGSSPLSYTNEPSGLQEGWYYEFIVPTGAVCFAINDNFNEIGKHPSAKKYTND